MRVIKNKDHLLNYYQVKENFLKIRDATKLGRNWSKLAKNLEKLVKNWYYVNFDSKKHIKIIK